MSIQRVFVPKAKLVNLLQQPEVRSWRTLMAAFQGVYAKLERELNLEGVSVSRFQILFYLYFEGGHKATELSKKLLVTRANMSTFLRRMESDKLISFKFSVGSKRPTVVITNQGTDFFENLFPRHINRVRKLVIPFAADTFKDLEKLKSQNSKGTKQ